MRAAAAREPRLTPASSRRLLTAGWLVAVAVATTLALRLALFRHIHVDEFHNIYSMQLMAFGQPDFADPAELYHVVFSFVTRWFSSTGVMLTALRLLFGALFVGLLLGIAWVQPFFPSPAGRLGVFVCVATWWPAWRHGYEVRHDLLLAWGVLLLYRLALAAEGAPSSRRALWSAGVIAAFMQLNSHKAVTLWGPGLLVLFVRALLRGRRVGARALAHLVVGLALGVGLGAALLSLCGAVPAFAAQLLHFAQYAAAAERFDWWPLLLFLLGDGPLLSVGTAGYLVVAPVLALRAQRPPHLFATACFATFALVALTVNPAPYPYNTVWLIPAVALAGTAAAQLLLVASGRWRRPLGAALIVASVAHFAAVRSTDRFTARGSATQRSLIAAAEALTGVDDPLYDGVGMVCTRPPATRHWLLHSLWMGEYNAQRRENLKDVIERAAPPVILGGHYRFGWLAAADMRALAAHYVALSPQLWVLGSSSIEDEHGVTLLRAGRYLVEAVLPGTLRVDVDDVAVTSGTVLELSAGPHRVVVDGGSSLAWLGPTLHAPPRVPRFRSGVFPDARLPGQ